MKEQVLNELITTFFRCNKDEIMDIFGEFLDTLQAEEMLPPGGTMSRNYETAQANPVQRSHACGGGAGDAGRDGR